MKKTLFYVLMLTVVLASLAFVACGTDDEIADGALGGACRAADDELGLCDEGLVCNADTSICEEPATDGDEDGDVDGDEDGDEDGDVTECNDDDCPGIQLCDGDACSADPAVICFTDMFNEDCAGLTDFATVAYDDGDKCAPVPCTTDEDCADLGACDESEDSSKVFECNAETDGVCVRVTE